MNIFYSFIYTHDDFGLFYILSNRSALLLKMAFKGGANFVRFFFF